MILEENLNYRLIGEIDVSSIEKKLDLVKGRWDEYDYRQKRYKDHASTKSVPLIFSEKLIKREEHILYVIFKDDILLIENYLRDKLCATGGLISAVLILLPSKESIKRHKDANPMGERFNRCHRIHIPIMTNHDCLFEIDNEYKNLKSGEVWEISNVTKYHSVSNSGDTDRIHLLLDWDPNLCQTSPSY
jgi:hypothetical protein